MIDSGTPAHKPPAAGLNAPIRKAIILLCALLCFIPPVQTLAPRALGFIPALYGFAFYSALRAFTGRWPGLSRTYIALTIGASLLAALSALWSLDPGFAIERTIKILVVLLGGVALFAVLRLNRSWPHFLYRAFPLAVLGAGILCAGELWSDGVVYRTWRGVDISAYSPSVTNRAVVSFILLLLPSLGFLRISSCSHRQKLFLLLALLIVTAAVVLKTQSQSAHLALAVAGLFWLAFPLFRFKIAQIGLIAAICCGILISPWLAQILYKTIAGDIHTLSWFANAYAADRLEIWDFVARKALENPLYGFGIEATRHIEHFDTAMLYTPLDHVLHPHNAVLQIWIEFGAIGALGLCVAVIFILRNIFSLGDSQSRALCLAVFMAAFVMACISYGLWQGWWLGLLSLVAALCGHLVDRLRPG